MIESDNYEALRQKLCLGPLYAPKHKKVFELMKILWNEPEPDAKNFPPSSNVCPDRENSR